MIPKRIHYCWFGKNPKPKLAQKCIKSWKKYCKDYEIIEWNEDNFDISSAPLYVRQAYEAKKWAFVTDYVRLWAMVNYGGIYLDTDVEVIKPLDQFLKHQAFSGFEDDIHIPTGIMACEKGFPLFQQLLHYYDDVPFVDNEGRYSKVTNVLIITEICKTKGLIQNNSYQEIEGFALYPKDYFCPFSIVNSKLILTKNSHTIHWFSGSWLPEKVRLEEKKRRIAHRKKERNRRISDSIDKIIHLPNIVLRKQIGEERYERLKGKMKK